MAEPSGAPLHHGPAAGEATDGETVDLRRPLAILLDLDETLVDNSGIPEAVSQACDLIAAAVEGLDARQLQEANTEAWGTYWPEVEELCWLGQMDGFSVSLEAWRRALHACSCTDESVIQFAFEQHRQLGRDAHRLFADVHEFLEHVTEAGIRLGLVTNGPSDYQRDKLRAVGLDDVFDSVLISGEHRLAKPDPALFRLALERLNVERQNVWHVGDSLTTDVAGAQSAGVRAAWLNRKGVRIQNDGAARPDLEVTSLSQVVKLLRQAGQTAT